ncbi:MAG: hypothetical protein NC411_08450 [Bacteroides sp.]|nr:hypothetical protein [Bacteroides sp.]
MITTHTTTGKPDGESTKHAKGGWNFPVSQKFYKNLCHRIEMILQALDHDSESVARLKSIVDTYLLNGETPSRLTIDGQQLAIFLCLRHDIDLAVERSARAKARAAERRAQKEAEKSQSEAPKSESNAPTPIATSDEETPHDHRQIPPIPHRRTSKRTLNKKFHKIKIRTIRTKKIRMSLAKFGGLD